MQTASNATSTSSLHPLLWVAGIAVTLLSLTGIAALTGLLPAKTAPAPERPAIVAVAPAPEPVAAPVVAAAAPAATPQAPAVAVGKTLPAVRHKAARRTVEQEVSASPAALPPSYASSVPPDYVPPQAAPYVPPAPPPCIDCGVIANVREVTNEAQASGAGAVIGGIAGAALGSNVGRGNTRTLASIAGAVGGGLLGNSIEKSQRSTVGFQVTVRMEDGTTRMIPADTMPSWRIGDKVKLVGGSIVSR
ncbi:MAG: glycine zipper 2TM domain-containing protein [Sulfuritalea sp.]|jgi:outer membrane lipoprotein SlyB|nr:glycine zipper 2TM domain-containing protein [Sulfuritalea sp.]